jgi:Spy/CpxP family protein refolding chaperone
MERAGGSHGAWWRNAEMAKKMGITNEQVQKLDAIFQQNRLALVDADANVRKEEIKLQPLVDADNPDEAAVIAQIDRVAQARAELEKTNARLLLGIRKQLTVEQWQKLKTEQQNHRPPMSGPQWQGGEHKDQHMRGGGQQQGPPSQGGPQGGPQGAEMQQPPADEAPDSPKDAPSSLIGF